MVDETVDLILVTEDGVEVTFLFHSNCLISQCYFYQKVIIPYTLKIYNFLLCFAFFHGKFRLRPKNALKPCTLLAEF